MVAGLVAIYEGHVENHDDPNYRQPVHDRFYDIQNTQGTAQSNEHYYEVYRTGNRVSHVLSCCSGRLMVTTVWCRNARDVVTGFDCA